MAYVCLDYGSKSTAHVTINSSVTVLRVEKKLLSCFNTVVRKYFKIFYDKQVIGNVLALHGTGVFDYDGYNCDDRLFGKFCWL